MNLYNNNVGFAILLPCDSTRTTRSEQFNPKDDEHWQDPTDVAQNEKDDVQEGQQRSTTNDQRSITATMKVSTTPMFYNKASSLGLFRLLVLVLLTTQSVWSFVAPNVPITGAMLKTNPISTTTASSSSTSASSTTTFHNRFRALLANGNRNHSDEPLSTRSDEQANNDDRSLSQSQSPTTNTASISTTDNNQDSIGTDKKEDKQMTLDEFLDQPFFDPSKVEEGSPLRWFADMIENDYETAEALYVGLIFFILVVIGQELLRIQLYGDNYVPFKTVVGSGRLF